MDRTFRFLGFGASRPDPVDRLIVHQFDPSQASPGGIDTCIRGLCKFMPLSTKLAVVGVAAGPGPAGRQTGKWERYAVGARELSFLPVAVLDPSVQNKYRVPHSARLSAGLVRHIRKLPRANTVQAHRADTALIAKSIMKSRFVYFIHTQDRGITSSSSDSIWTRAARVHEALEKKVISTADSIVVFNEAYSEQVRLLNTSTVFSPTWFDPELIRQVDHPRGHQIVWVGRLERPKDPMLALHAFAALLRNEPDRPWKLAVIGSGQLSEELKEAATRINGEIGERIELLGRLSPLEVSQKLTSSDLFLMTSQPGYEGYPRVLVESMATGLVPVVTQGSDTGGLIADGCNGFVTSRDPELIAEKLSAAGVIPSENAVTSAIELSAPTVVSQIFASTS